MTTLSPTDYEQAKHSYRSFGDAIRIFLHTPSTIPETSCPQTYLQLISLCDIRDGFILLQTLVFTCSPQLSGRYRDYRHQINSLSLTSGEHLSKFYQRAVQLSTEITLSRTSDGSSTDLHYKFLSLLCSTGNPTIQSITAPYWAMITKHRRDPDHFTISIPFSLKSIYDDLENSEITILSTTTSSLSDEHVITFCCLCASTV